MPDAVGSVADLCRSVQYSLEHFHFNGLYVDCITDCMVLPVKSFIVTVISLKNNYKERKVFSLTHPYRILRPASLIFNGIGQFSPTVKTIHLLKFHSFFHEQTKFFIIFLPLISLTTGKSQDMDTKMLASTVGRR